MKERIYKGATRPAMVVGVPLRVLVPVGGALLFVLAWGTWLAAKWDYGWVVFSTTALVMAALFAWARDATAKDDQRLLQWWKSKRMQWLHRNTSIWKCRSYSPTVHKGAYDEWFH